MSYFIIQATAVFFYTHVHNVMSGNMLQMKQCVSVHAFQPLILGHQRVPVTVLLTRIGMMGYKLVITQFAQSTRFLDYVN